MAPRNNSVNEIVQARVNVNGETFDTFEKEHLTIGKPKLKLIKRKL